MALKRCAFFLGIFDKMAPVESLISRYEKQHCPAGPLGKCEGETLSEMHGKTQMAELSPLLFLSSSGARDLYFLYDICCFTKVCGVALLTQGQQLRLDCGRLVVLPLQCMLLQALDAAQIKLEASFAGPCVQMAHGSQQIPVH